MPGAGRFATTRWSLVLSAGRADERGSSEALAVLCETYWPPVYAYIRRSGYNSDEAQDLTQEFFTRVIEKHYFADADPVRGRFRSFLLASVRHFLSNERDARQALKRGGALTFVQLEVEGVDTWLAIEGHDDVTPEKLFDRRWALTLLDRAVVRLAGECKANGKGRLFDRLKDSLSGERLDTYSAVAAELRMTEQAVKVTIYRLRRRLRDILNEEILDTVFDPRDVAAELVHLRNALKS
jgi:RNA polymerase sigma factor (sigma-70 family)